MSMSDAGQTIAPEPKHHCSQKWPWRDSGYGSTGVSHGTIWICPTCDTAWFSGPCWESLGPTEHWRRVRPWHYRLRRRIAAAQADGGAQ